jgi:hypothetical protein
MAVGQGRCSALDAALERPRSRESGASRTLASDIFSPLANGYVAQSAGHIDLWPAQRDPHASARRDSLAKARHYERSEGAGHSCVGSKGKELFPHRYRQRLARACSRGNSITYTRSAGEAEIGPLREARIEFWDSATSSCIVRCNVSAHRAQRAEQPKDMQKLWSRLQPELRKKYEVF